LAPSAASSLQFFDDANADPAGAVVEVVVAADGAVVGCAELFLLEPPQPAAISTTAATRTDGMSSVDLI
jgi:hypothetical protein